MFSPVVVRSENVGTHDVSPVDELAGGTPNLENGVSDVVDCARLVASCGKTDNVSLIDLRGAQKTDDENSVSVGNTGDLMRAFESIDDEGNQNERSDNKRKLVNDAENVNRVKIIRTM